MAKQKLITKAIENQLLKSPLYSTSENMDAKSICKFFNPYGVGTWYVFEGEKQSDGDWLFFGYAEIQCGEFGYFRLSELESVRINLFGISAGIERDYYHTPVTKRELLNKSFES